MPEIDVLLYIALSEEFESIATELVNEFGDGFVAKELGNIAITVFLGKVHSPESKQDLQLAVVPAGKMGNSRSASVTSAILSEYDVRNVVVLGLAGSLSRDLLPGDVFIPDSVVEFLADSAAVDTNDSWKFETSGNAIVTAPRLLNRFQNWSQTRSDWFDAWQDASRDRFRKMFDEKLQLRLEETGIPSRETSALVVGDARKLASGPTVGKGEAFAKWICHDVDRKVVAIEMESSGVYDASLIRDPQPRIIAIRGISDFADNRKYLVEDSAQNRFRLLAAKNALSVLICAMGAGLFGPSNSKSLATRPNEENKVRQLPRSCESSDCVAKGLPTMLIADDMIADNLASTFKPQFSITVARNGHDVVSLLEQQRFFDICIIDINMPPESAYVAINDSYNTGIRLIERILEGRHSKRFVVVTARQDEAYIKQEIQRVVGSKGSWRFLRAETSFDALQNTVSTLLTE